MEVVHDFAFVVISAKRQLLKDLLFMHHKELSSQLKCDSGEVLLILLDRFDQQVRKVIDVHLD